MQLEKWYNIKSVKHVKSATQNEYNTKTLQQEMGAT